MRYASYTQPEKVDEYPRERGRRDSKLPSGFRGVARMVALEHKVEEEFMRLMPGRISCSGIYSWEFVLTGNVLL